MKQAADITDIELAQLCARGDEKARKELYTRYATYLYALCIRYVSDREEARDLMHDSMVRIFDKIGKYKPTGSLKSWCTRVTVNHVLDRMRRNRRFETVSLDAYDVNVPEPHSEALMKIPEEALMKMIAELSHTKRVVFNLYCVEGYSHKDIAKMLGMKEKTSSSILFKAREQLAYSVRNYIKENGL